MPSEKPKSSIPTAIVLLAIGALASYLFGYLAGFDGSLFRVAAGIEATGLSLLFIALWKRGGTPKEQRTVITVPYRGLLWVFGILLTLFLLGYWALSQFASGPWH